MTGKWRTVLAATGAALSVAAPASAATATFDFEDAPAATTCATGLPSVPFTRGAVTATLSREGDGGIAFTYVGASHGPGDVPDDWGDYAMCPAPIASAGAIVVDFSTVLSQASIEFGDYSADREEVVLTGYDGPGGTGNAVATDTVVVPQGPLSGPFVVGVADAHGAGIRSITIRATGDFDGSTNENSLYFDNLRVTTAGGCSAADGAAGCWHFDEPPGASTAVDSSGNGNDGAYVNGPLLGVAGVLGTAVSMDGSNDHVRVPDSPSLHTGDSFSLVGWVKRDEDGHVHQLFNKGGRSYQLVVMSRYEGNQVWLRKAGSSTIVRSDGSVPADGAWHQVVATKDGPGSAQLYIDGVAQDEQVVSAAQVIQDTTFPLYFSATPTGNVVAGDLDEFAVHDRALTPAEVAATDSQAPEQTSSSAPTAASVTPRATTSTSTSSAAVTCGKAGTATSGITGLTVAGVPCLAATAAAYAGPSALRKLGFTCAVTGEDWTTAVTRITHSCTGLLGLRLKYVSLS